MVDFAGWDMPLHYGSQIEEHKAVRADAGMFDVSHMHAVDLEGGEVVRFLRYLMANDVARLEAPGKALYTCMLNPAGGVIDDLIVYRCYGEWFRGVVNSARREQDVDWMRRQAESFHVSINPRDDLAIVAVQGPNARARVLSLLKGAEREQAGALRPFQCHISDSLFISRTGYTGEDGFEIMLSAGKAPTLWKQLREKGVVPCGLGARDTLRLEAGLHLNGQDMDEETDPLSAGLGWTVAWEPADRDFIGREALEALRERGGLPKCAGLIFSGRGVLRHGQSVHAPGGEAPIGEITSGSFSPALGCSIAIDRKSVV